jgi:hypothetical protein
MMHLLKKMVDVAVDGRANYVSGCDFSSIGEKLDCWLV